jgi:hypothetical protein
VPDARVRAPGPTWTVLEKSFGPIISSPILGITTTQVGAGALTRPAEQRSATTLGS